MFQLELFLLPESVSATCRFKKPLYEFHEVFLFSVYTVDKVNIFFVYTTVPMIMNIPMPKFTVDSFSVQNLNIIIFCFQLFP